MGKRNSSSLAPSSPMPLPYQTPPPRRRKSGGASDDDDDYSSCRQLAIATTPTTLAATAGRRFSLPPGWGTEEIPRSDGSRVDRYYYEPGTGERFRSLKEVERHLKGFKVYRRRLTRSNCSKESTPSQKMIVYGGRMVKLEEEEEVNVNNWAIVPCGNAVTPPYELPDGWIVEEVPRRFGNTRDKYYYEPGTGRKFRSRVAVERHLEELSEHMPLSETLEELNENKPLAKMFKWHQNTSNFAPCKRKTSRKDSFVKPPSKVNWVIASGKGDSWNPFIGDALVSDSVKQQWSKRFMLFMNDETSELISV